MTASLSKFQKKNLKQCDNWRGICVSPAITKIIAKIILERIKDHLNSSLIMSKLDSDLKLHVLSTLKRSDQLSNRVLSIGPTFI